MANYTLGSTPAADANKLQWHKIKDGSKTLLICDRNILVSVSWNDLNEQGYITGKTVTIDGATYKCRVLTGGTGPRSSDWYAGGTPTNNEWDRFITREEVITGLPAPTSSDLDTSLAAADKTSAHNQFWNWMGCYSWCQEVYSGNSSSRAVRGWVSARYWSYHDAAYRGVGVGFRPVLEPLASDNIAPNCQLDGVYFQLRSIPGGEGFCPVLQPTQKNIFGSIPTGHQVQMYTFMEDGRPVHLDEAVKDVSKLMLTDRYFGDEYLATWTISNGVAIASKTLIQQI